ncbi:UDP-2,3-diacylglucosamine hydrolase [Rheinheimera sp. A13L]|uniref:UDP-2,3-diacylglucosamine diphosphatase n=1 Tax=Rheinheimera sp. A13L TaxID=506534 RepID=UPI000212512D|nr:UDP-2,3-diacylglucosamine diphosphatase [Rheinheimera sp. A13L]EGM77485.1 UDP-2,3-diacylglucosamine hydrolase [Rheinheimera sp. A13L]
MAKGHSLFIADLHLSEQRPDITAAFLLFLQQKAAEADALYILGDLFEVWIGDDNPSPLLAEVATAIKALTDSAIPVYFCHGNRDFLLGQKFARRSGMQLLEPLTVVDLYGTPTLLMHGDSLCTLDIGYQKFRAWWDQKWWQKLILSLPLWYRQHLARKARRVSAMDKQGKTSDIMDVTPDEVPKVMAQYQVQHLIHGHTHRPAVHSLQGADGSAAQRYVLGDWYSQSSYLDVSASDWQLHFNPLSRAQASE